jgi:hypothetical protein
MSELELHVEVKGGDTVVTLPGVDYSVTYFKPERAPQLLAKDISDRDDRRQLHGKHFPEEVDRRSPISQAAFVRKAWRLANDKARELGWGWVV